MAGSHQGLPHIFVHVWRITLKSRTGGLGRILRTGDQCCKRTMYLLQTMSDFNDPAIAATPITPA